MMQMTPLQWLILGGLVAGFVIILVAVLKSREEHDLDPVDCSIVPSFCNIDRRKFWDSLQRAVGDDYVVLPTVPLATLISCEEDEDTQEWLRSHWVDFGILEGETFLPVAVVQFERQPEDEEDPLWKRGKDSRLVKVLGNAGLPLLWLPSDQYQHVELLRHALDQAKTQAQVAVDFEGSEESGQSS